VAGVNGEVVCWRTNLWRWKFGLFWCLCRIVYQDARQSASWSDLVYVPLLRRTQNDPSTRQPARSLPGSFYQARQASRLQYLLVCAGGEDGGGDNVKYFLQTSDRYNVLFAECCVSAGCTEMFPRLAPSIGRTAIHLRYEACVRERAEAHLNQGSTVQHKQCLPVCQEDR